MELLATFTNTHRVLKAEKVLKDAGITFKLLPSPKVLSSGCSLVIGFNGSDRAGIEEVLKRAGVKVHAVYTKDKEGVYVKV